MIIYTGATAWRRHFHDANIGYGQPASDGEAPRAWIKWDELAADLPDISGSEICSDYAMSDPSRETSSSYPLGVVAQRKFVPTDRWRAQPSGLTTGSSSPNQIDPRRATSSLATQQISGERHEHSCIRCPMLRVDPRQRARLVEIIANLTERIEEAELHGWLGEKEGLGVSLQAARAKLATLDRY